VAVSFQSVKNAKNKLHSFVLSVKSKRAEAIEDQILEPVLLHQSHQNWRNLDAGGDSMADSGGVWIGSDRGPAVR